jgi:hypothetical protein
MGDGLQLRVRQAAVPGTVAGRIDEDELDGGCADAAEWKTRILDISEHI